ncbi:MAG: hypothetical protein ACI9EK_001832 [Psychroserpens sp.]|jgi:hypothetical protein
MLLNEIVIKYVISSFGQNVRYQLNGKSDFRSSMGCERGFLWI